MLEDFNQIIGLWLSLSIPARLLWPKYTHLLVKMHVMLFILGDTVNTQMKEKDQVLFRGDKYAERDFLRNTSGLEKREKLIIITCHSKKVLLSSCWARFFARHGAESLI